MSSLASKISKTLNPGGGSPRPELLSFHTPKTQEPRTKTSQGQPAPGRGGIRRMANRVIRDAIWNSPSLARLSLEADAWFPRWVLMADDWGCFQADPKVIKGLIYPLRDDVTSFDVVRLAVEYYNNGQLFLWQDDDRIWGFLTSFASHNEYLRKLEVDEHGKQKKNRRRSPEPPAEELSLYLKERKEIKDIFDIVRQDSTRFNKSRVSVSISKSVSVSKLKDGGARKAAPPPPGFNSLIGKLQEAWKAKYGANLNWQGKDGATLKALLARNEEALICEGWQLYLDDPDDYCRQNGQSFLNFASMFDKVVSRLAQKKKDQEWMEGKTG